MQNPASCTRLHIFFFFLMPSRKGTACFAMFDYEFCLSLDILILCRVFYASFFHPLPKKGVEFPFLFLSLTASLSNLFQWPRSSWDSLFLQQYLSVVIIPALFTSSYRFMLLFWLWLKRVKKSVEESTSFSQGNKTFIFNFGGWVRCSDFSTNCPFCPSPSNLL